MLSYDLMRIGRVIRGSSVAPTDILKLVSDVASNQARNFLAKVIIVEVDKRNNKSCDVAVLPIRECGSWVAETKKRSVFVPDVNQALAFPFIIPSGGNPIHAQGIYPVAAYPVYERHFKDFNDKEGGITAYLSSRLERTIDINLEPDEISKIASSIKKVLPGIKFEGKKLGLMVLAIIQDDSPHFLIKPGADTDGYLILGNSQLNPGLRIAVDTDKLLSNFWVAKFVEGEAGGHKDEGICSICKKSGAVVSAYNKALYWLPTTWEAPLSFGRDKDLVESIALCTECYSDLTLGASVFSKMSQELDRVLTKEVFAPVASPIGKEYSLKGSIKDVIYGSMVTLPLDDRILDDKELADEWVYSISDIIGDDTPLDVIGRKGTSKTRHLKNITGFEARLPEEWDNEEFRLTLIYFSGDPGKLNIHLRAVISDVLPTTASHLQEICEELREQIQEIIDDGYIMLSEKSIARKQRQISTLPYLLATAYGPPYVWGSMEKALKREPLDKTLFYKNSSSRMTQLGKLLPDSIFDLQQETIDYLAINQFLSLYNSNLASSKGGEEGMKTAMELISATWNTPVDELQFETLDELGFAAGQVVQRFGRSYYAGTNKKDYIKHRIMTFGTSLTPEVIHHKALGRMEEYAAMLGLGVAPDVFKRAAVVSMGFVQFEDEIKNNKDRFMAAFWAGYSLGRKEKDDESDSNEEGNN
jgi:hypothetical protein